MLLFFSLFCNEYVCFGGGGGGGIGFKEGVARRRSSRVVRCLSLGMPLRMSCVMWCSCAFSASRSLSCFSTSAALTRRSRRMEANALWCWRTRTFAARRFQSRISSASSAEARFRARSFPEMPKLFRLRAARSSFAMLLRRGSMTGSSQKRKQDAETQP